MNKHELLQDIYSALDRLEGASPWDTSEIETTRDALATAIEDFVNADRNEDERETFYSLDEAIRALEISQEIKKEISNMLGRLDDILEARSYDSDDEDEDLQESRIDAFKQEFYDTLKPELDELQRRLS